MDLSQLPREKLEKYKRLLDAKKILKGRSDFLYFVTQVWPDFIYRKASHKTQWGHHQLIADKFDQIADKKINRLIVNMPPRHTKSEFASYLLPAWIIGKNPKAKIMQVSHNAELSQRFGRKVRNLVDSPEYKKIFQNVTLSQDSKAAGRWETNQGGEYYAAGVGGSITGRGADILIIDDPHTEQNTGSKDSLEKTFEWYTSGPRQRLQPGGSIILVMTRWASNDLTGKLIREQRNPGADQWDVIEFPAILPNDEPVWPEYWSKEALLSTKASLPVSKWNAQYMQNPTAEEGAILKREWWQPWDGDSLPELTHVIQSYDTAFSKKETADYSAITTWGVFTPFEDYKPALILLDALRGRYDFPELKMVAFDQYKYWDPETVIVEKKATGEPLIQEMRRMGIPVIDFTPVKGIDKHARVHACAPVFESGQVFYPEGERFAEELIEECAAFPFGEHDDYVDSTTQAVLRYRKGNFVSLFSDEADEPKEKQERPRYYFD